MTPTYLTFDCYDTLVQYSAAKRACMAALAARQRPDIDTDAVVAAQGDAEKELHLGPFTPLREVLRLSLRRAYEVHDLTYIEADGAALENAVRFAPPFPETRAVLNRLAEHFRLVIISNSEPDIIADNIAAIGAPFHDAITAGLSKAYKPDHRMFHFVLERLGCDKQDLVHIAAGFYHDIETASALGWRRVWINRTGHPGDPAFGPYNEQPDLTGVPALLDI